MTFNWITFTTDYGLRDGFVAACHGVIARQAPQVRVIDVSHLIEPGNIRAGALVLAQTIASLPSAVHVAVVDPGVGTDRRGIVIVAANGVLVGPDNGLMIPAAEALGGIREAFELVNSAWFAREVSPTFHGRDIFAPTAARIASGSNPADAGPSIDAAHLIRLPDPEVTFGPDFLDSEVIGVDHFGNIQLGAGSDVFAALQRTLWVDDHRALKGRTFADVPINSLVVLLDSAGKIAVAANQGNAADMLQVRQASVVRIASSPPSHTCMPAP